MRLWQKLSISLPLSFLLLFTIILLLLRRRRRQKPSPFPQSIPPSKLSLHQSLSLLRHTTPQSPYTWTLLPNPNSLSKPISSSLKLNPHGAKLCLAKLNLPLPGPQLQGGYFEITLLHLQQTTSNKKKENSKEEEEEEEEEREEEEEEGFVCVGLTKDGVLNCPPGSYRGSIGFHSSGSLNLDGMNLVAKSEKTRWGEPNKTIGCGFDPAKKTVFFTLDSTLTHHVRCTSEAFSHPLFPAMAANTEVEATVNFGQRPFMYHHRSPERVSLSSPLLPSPRTGFDFSGELFSMERMEETFRVVGSRKSSPLSGSRRDTLDDSDLFEISLSR